VQLSDGRSFEATAKLNTVVELAYFRHGGLLNYVAKQWLDIS
jgi:aconitase A